VRRAFLPRTLFLAGLVLLVLLTGRLTFGQAPERGFVNVKSSNTLSAEWLVFNPETKSLIPFIQGEGIETQAYYQWLTIRGDYPFEITFPANKDLCLFLNNKLIFKADSSAKYTLDLTSLVLLPARENKYLFSVWSPNLPPALEAFKNSIANHPNSLLSQDEATLIQNKPRTIANQSAFIIFLLLIGVIYGSLRSNFATDFASVFRAGNLFRSYSLEEGFLTKSIASWSSILFILAFSLSFALLIVAIHTNIQNIFIFRQVFLVSESDIVSRIIFDALLILGFVLLKYLYLQILSYVFGLGSLVSLHYREFLRSVLFLGMFLPFVMLFYLAFNQVNPGTVLLVSTLAVTALLVLTVLRVSVSLNKKLPILNLHLFSYLCATEIIPLAVMLKLIVFNY
jgi:hypothetical protein